MKQAPLILIASVLLVFAGCATVSEKSPAVSVSAFAQPEAAGLRKFEIVKSPRNQAQPEFEEIAAALQARLVGAGYVPADHSGSDLTIFVNYLSDDTWKLLPVNEPEMSLAGGDNINSGVASTDNRIPVTTTYSMARLTKTGPLIPQPPAVVSMVSVSIQAVPTAHYRHLASLPREEWNKHPASAAWEIHAWYVGKGALEVRQIVPDIIKLVAPYFAKNSRGTVEIPYDSAGLSK